MTYYDSNTWNIHLKGAYISRKTVLFFFKNISRRQKERREKKAARSKWDGMNWESTGLIALSPFDSPFSPPGHLYFLSPSPLLYITLWNSLVVLGCGEYLGIWLLIRLLSPLWLSLFSPWSSLSPSSLSSSRHNFVNLSGYSWMWRIISPLT